MIETSISANWTGRDAESLLWLASFPRSGNTFTRILLANYFAATSQAFNINELYGFIPADTSALLWEEYADKPDTNTLEWNWSNRAGFFDYYRKKFKPLGFAGLKTHTANIATLGSEAFKLRKNDRAIYIVRHPLDVLLSYADFNGRNLDSAIDVMCLSGACVQIASIGGVEVRGSWSEHVSSWLNTTNCPVLLVRYEELCSNTEQILKSILEFLGAPIDPGRLRRAVEDSRFDKVREQETLNSFIEMPAPTTSGSFFRKGTSFQWLRELAPEQAYRLADACEPIMSKLGYTHPRDVFFDGRNALQPVHLTT